MHDSLTAKTALNKQCRQQGGACCCAANRGSFPNDVAYREVCLRVVFWANLGVVPTSLVTGTCILAEGFCRLIEIVGDSI